MGAGLEGGDTPGLGVLSVHEETSWGQGSWWKAAVCPNLIGPNLVPGWGQHEAEGALATCGTWP